MNITHLQIHKNVKAKNVKNIEQLIITSDLASILYENLIKEWIVTEIPIIGKDSITFAMKEAIENQNYEKLIQSIVIKNNISNSFYTSKTEKRNILNCIMGCLLDEANSIVKTNPTFYLITIYSILEYNRFFTVGLLKNLEYIYKTGQINEEDRPAEKLISCILDSFLTFSKLPNFEFSTTYKSVESQLAQDRLALEFAFNYAYSFFDHNFEDINHSNQDDIIKLISVFRAIDYIRCIISLYVEGVNKNDILEINEEGNINIFVNGYRKYNHNFLDYIVYDQQNLSTEHNSTEIDNIFKKHYGINIGCVFELCDDLTHRTDIPNVILCGEINQWTEVLMEKFNLTQEETIKFLDKLTTYSDRESILGNDNSRKYRLMRQPIYAVNDQYICQSSLLLFALLGHVSDVYSGMIKDNDLKKELEKYYKKKNMIFEKVVSQNLLKVFPVTNVLENVHETQIKGNYNSNKYLVELPGEIDILFHYDNTIFVIECKNINYSINHKSMSNEFQNLSSKYQKKLDAKVRVIKENIQYVLNYLGKDYIVKNEYYVKGIIVLPNYTFHINQTTYEYPLLHIRDLNDYILKCI